MPLFFVISGLCIKESKELTKEIFLKMIKAYLFPYAVWTLIYMAVFTALELPTGQNGLLIYQLAHAISICGLAPLWFFWPFSLQSLLLSKLFSPNIFGALIITAATTLFCLAIDQIMGRFRLY